MNDEDLEVLCETEYLLEKENGHTTMTGTSGMVLDTHIISKDRIQEDCGCNKKIGGLLLLLQQLDRGRQYQDSCLLMAEVHMDTLKKLKAEHPNQDLTSTR